MYKFDFTKLEYDHFLEQCPFTDEEIEIFKLRRRGKSVCKMSMDMNLSERTIKRRIKSINNKLIRVL